MLPKNVISWFQIPTLDFDRAVKFYSDILEHPINVRDFEGAKMGFFPMQGGPESTDVGGALIPPMDRGDKPSHDGSQVFLSAEGSIDTILGKVAHSGGKVLVQKTAIGDAGFFAFFEDSEGNKIGLHSKA